MGLRENLPDAYKPKCGIALLGRTAPPELMEELAELLAESATSDLSLTRIAKAMKAEGYEVSSHTLSRHRNRNCTCEQP